MEVERETVRADLPLRTARGGISRSAIRRMCVGRSALADGNDNIAQALLMRLRVRKGELARRPGPTTARLGELIGEPDLPRRSQGAQVFARGVEADPRVEKCRR